MQIISVQRAVKGSENLPLRMEEQQEVVIRNHSSFQGENCSPVTQLPIIDFI